MVHKIDSIEYLHCALALHITTWLLLTFSVITLIISTADVIAQLLAAVQHVMSRKYAK